MRNRVRWQDQGVSLSRPATIDRDSSMPSRVDEKAISQLSGSLGADPKATLAIEALARNGASDDVVRIVTQNSRDLKFETQGFEE